MFRTGISRYPPEQENLVEPLVDSDTSKEQEATNMSLTPSEDEHDVSEGEIHAESTLNSAPGGNKRKTPYAIKFDELPETVRKLVSSEKKFFTQKVNFERQKAPVDLSTYDKAQERILCKYLWLFLAIISTFALSDDRYLGDARSLFNNPSFFIFFAGFLGYVKTTLAHDEELLPDCFFRIPLIGGYVEFLKVREILCFDTFVETPK